LLMEQDDLERRIAELERQLPDATAAGRCTVDEHARRLAHALLRSRTDQPAVSEVAQL
jgi:hypothetical protein